MPQTNGKVLILSPHVMTAALVGWYVELSKLEPAFAAPAEQPSDALARVKPLLVVMVDTESEQAINDLFAARAVKRAVGVTVFSGSADHQSGKEWAEQHGFPFFKLPVDLEAFGRVLDQGARIVPERRLFPDRRQPVGVSRAVDGTLCLTDEAGRAWYVYDRRGADRRASGPYRAFVSADGEELRAPMTSAQFAEQGPSELIAQLARAKTSGG